jgi:putative ABC transport system permease protein
MIGLGLVVFVAIFGASARASTESVLDRTLKADFILSSPTFTGFSTAAADAMRPVPGVATVSQMRQAEVHIKGSTAFVSGLDPSTFPEVSDVRLVAGSITDLAHENTVAVFDDVARDNGWEIGDTVHTTFPATGEVDLQVAAIYEENGLVGDYAISLDTFDANVSQVLDVFVLVNAEEGANVAAVQADLTKALRPYPNIEVQDQATLAEKYATFLNQVLNLVTALLLFAVVIALFGVMNTLYLSIYERTRELGLLRAIGLTRRQTRSMVRREAGIIAVMGALFGVVIGIAFGWALQQALESRGFSEFGIPTTELIVYVVLAAVLGWLFAFLPARRAARLNVLQAIAYE